MKLKAANSCFIIAVIASLFLCKGQLYAQKKYDKVVSVYSKFVSEFYDVKFDAPNGFKCVNSRELWKADMKNKKLGYSYNAIFTYLSDDASCVILYPDFTSYYEVYKRFKARPLKSRPLSLDDEMERMKADTTIFKEQVMEYTGDGAKRYFNSDTVYVYDVRLAQPYRDKYPYLTSIYAGKNGHSDLHFKCFFTDEGYKNKELYIVRLLKSVKYMSDKEVAYQERAANFTIYSKYVMAVFDIQWKKPQGFTDLNKSMSWGNDVRWEYNATFGSEDKNCMILYPFIYQDLYLGKDMGNIIKEDLGVSRRSVPKEKAEAEYAKRVEMLCGDEARHFFNADTLYRCEIPLKQPFEGEYLYCTGIYAYKKGHPKLFFKCFFTEEGKRAEAVYLNKLYQAVKYRHDNWTYDKQKGREEYYKMKIRANK